MLIEGEQSGFFETNSNENMTNFLAGIFASGRFRRGIGIIVPTAFIGLLILLLCERTKAQVLGDPPDISQDFQKQENVYFIGSRVADFDAATGAGNLIWDRYLRSTTLSFNKIDVGLTKGKATEFPPTEYDENPSLPFSISFVSPRTIRLRFNARQIPIENKPSLMLGGARISDAADFIV